LKNLSIQQVRSFWEENPLCAGINPHPLGSKEYFAYYDCLREANESVEFSRRVHEYDNFPGKKVLDVGCGNGYVLSRYAREKARTFGVDLTWVGIALSRQRFALEGLSGEFINANAEDLPFATESFDCVCSMGVLHHTPNTVSAVDEIYRVLKPGGRLILMLYHRNSALYRIKYPLVSLLSGKSIQQLVNEADGVGNPKGEVYSEKEMRNLLYKFHKLEIFPGCLKGFMLLPRIGQLIPDGLLRRFEQRWGWFLYAKGTKS